MVVDFQGYKTEYRSISSPMYPLKNQGPVCPLTNAFPFLLLCIPDHKGKGTQQPLPPWWPLFENNVSYEKNPFYFPLYWLVYRDPYIGLL